MPWQQVSPGRYERDFNSIECFYRTIADAGTPLQKQHFHISSCARLKIAPVLAELQRAWKALRHLGVRPSMPGCGKQSFLKKLRTALPRISTRPSHRRRALSCTSCRTRVSCCSARHTSGSMGLGCCICKTPSSVSWPMALPARGFRPTIRLPASPPLDEVACVPQEGTPAIRQAADEEINVCLSGLPALSLATKPVPLPARTRRHGINLPPALSQRIFAACKEREVTVTATVHAALILAMAPHAQHNFDPATRGVGGGKYTAWIPLDLRKYLPAPWNQAAVSVYHTGLPCSINLSDTNGFDAIAAALGSVYRRPLDKDEPRNLFHFLSEYVRKTLGLLSAVPADPLKAPAHPELSSLGRINDYVQTAYVGAACTVEIEDWWMAIEQVTRSFQAYLWTWDGQLHLGANYNDAFYEAGFIEAFVDKWKAMLVQAFGVE